MGIVFSNDDWSVKTTDEIENELRRAEPSPEELPVPDEPAKDDETAAKEAKREQLRKNRAQGRAYEQKGRKTLESRGNTDITEQIILETPVTGVRTRADFLSRDTSGAVKVTEAKSSASAPLTKNQSKAFPEIETEGATVVGKGKPPFTGGTKIPPTKVEVMRPEGVD